MLLRANNAGMISHIYFSIIYQTTNWQKARETGTVGRRSDAKSSKAKWPDVASVCQHPQRGKTASKKGLGEETGWMGASPCHVGDTEREASCLYNDFSHQKWLEKHLILSTSDRWQKEKHCCQFSLLWTAGNTKSPTHVFLVEYCCGHFADMHPILMLLTRASVPLLLLHSTHVLN